MATSRRNTQLAFEDVEGYETEQLNGGIGPAFPVIVQATTDGASVMAPEGVIYRCWRDNADTTHVHLSFRSRS